MPELEGRDLQGTSYRLELAPFRGVDFSRRCFVFPGQGAASPGMALGLLGDYQEVRDKFQQADEQANLLGCQAPSLYIRRPAEIPEGQLAETRNTALFTLGLALFDVAARRLGPPALVTGHSFGEYAAFVASGMMDFREMLGVVVARDRSCPAPGSCGVMVAVKADAAAMQEFLVAGEVTVANKNSPNQTVCALPRAKLERFLSALKGKGFAATVLDSVPQPYHSPLLAASAAAFEERLRAFSVQLRAPTLPMLSSVSGEVLRREGFSAERAARLLNRQLTAPVDFVSQIHSAVRFGCCNFVEMSHRAFCAQWIAEILGERPHKISMPVRLGESSPRPRKSPTRKSFDAGIVGALNRVIASVTGYSVEEIGVGKSFREDLAIDSIKTAQIILEFLESQGRSAKEFKNIPLSAIKTADHVLDWYMESARGKSSAAAPVFSLYAADWENLPARHEVRSQRAPGDWRWVSVQSLAAGVGLPEPGGAADQSLVFFDEGGAFSFADFLAEMRRAYAFFGRERWSSIALVANLASPPEVRALNSFFQSLARETGVSFTSVELGETSSAPERTIVQRQIEVSRGKALRTRCGAWQEKRYVPYQSPSGAPSMPRTILAIGGSRGITREILKSMLVFGVESVFVLGLRPEPQAREDLQDLRALGTLVEYRQGDASSRTDMKRVLEEIFAQRGGIDLVIHGGGVETSGLLKDQRWDTARPQIGVKQKTVRNLAEFWESCGIGRAICFSSVAAEFGNAGQTVYAYANEAMSLECERANAAGAAFSVIAWPAWNRVGMTESEGIYQQLQAAGHSFLETASGCRFFHQVLLQKHPARFVCADSAWMARP